MNSTEGLFYMWSRNITVLDGRESRDADFVQTLLFKKQKDWNLELCLT